MPETTTYREPHDNCYLQCACYHRGIAAEKREATASAPERDLAEQVLAALETLAIVGACGRLYLSDEGEPLDMCSVTCDVLKGKYRYWFADTNQAARDEDGSLVTRAEALERLRLMATDVGHWNAVAADTAMAQGSEARPN